MINPLGIELLLANLIQNAAQSGEGVRVQIKTEPTAQGVRLTVQDNGSGIREEEIQRAFDPFYSTPHQEGRVGLGLSIVHAIVEDHAGSIEMSSDVGRGTKVIVELPITPIKNGP